MIDLQRSCNDDNKYRTIRTRNFDQCDATVSLSNFDSFLPESAEEQTEVAEFEEDKRQDLDN